MAIKRHQTVYDIGAENRTDAAMRAVENNLKRVNGAASRMGETFRAVLGATITAGFTREMARAAIEAEQSSNRLTAVLKAQGGVAGQTRQQIEGLVDTLADRTAFDDEGIRRAAAELVKFGNIHGEVFKRGLELSADMAAFMGTDVAEAAQIVGKALQSPTEGLRALTMQFGKLTEAEETNIKTLAAQGRAVEAQNAVLAILQKKIGGTAELMNTGLTKATRDVSKAWNEFMETAGAKGTVLNNTLGGATALLKDVKGEMEGVRTPLRGLMEDSLTWLGYLRFVPGAIGAIGKAAQDAALQVDKQRRTVGGKIRNPELEGISSFEASLANTPTVPVKLGGKTTGDDAGAKAKAQREAEFRAEKSVDLEEMAAQDSREAWQVYTDGRIAQDKQLKEGRERMMKDWFATIDAEQEYAIEQGRELLETIAEQEKKAAEEAERFGMTIDLAFDRAVRGGGDLLDILKDLVTELAMIEIKKRFFEQASKGLSGFLDELFKPKGGGAPVGESTMSTGDFGAQVVGGPGYAMGTDYVPRTGFALVHQGEKITSRGRNNGGSPTFVFNNHVDSRTDAGQVYQAIDRSNRMAEARILDSFRRGGAFARAAGTA
jgi:hypothetical protein